MFTVQHRAAQAISEAYNRMLRYHQDRELSVNQQQPQNGLLYHYTSADGLKGIIQNDEIWATSAYYLNDSAEVLYGYRVLQAALDLWLKKSISSEDSISRGTAESLQQHFGHAALERDVIKPIYLTCFCEEDNLLSQWRTYGMREGTAWDLGSRQKE